MEKSWKSNNTAWQEVGGHLSPWFYAFAVYRIHKHSGEWVAVFCLLPTMATQRSHLRFSHRMRRCSALPRGLTTFYL